MNLTVADLSRIAGNNNYASRKKALCDFLNGTAMTLHPQIGRPHDMAQFLAQIMHESARLRYVKEIWGPTAAQRRYEGRKDLGNTQAGDGKRFQGRDIIQVTGRDNYRALTKWVWSLMPGAPDFEKNPVELESPKWLGMGALWYWSQRVPKKYVDSGDVEMVSVRVNGGRNGLEDRFNLYDRSALVLLGRSPDDVKGFQISAGLEPDGISGPKTRAALHSALAGKAAPTAPVRPDVDPHPQNPTKTPPAPAPGLLAAILNIIKAILGRK